MSKMTFNTCTIVFLGAHIYKEKMRKQEELQKLSVELCTQPISNESRWVRRDSGVGQKPGTKRELGHSPAISAHVAHLSKYRMYIGSSLAVCRFRTILAAETDPWGTPQGYNTHQLYLDLHGDMRFMCISLPQL